MEDICEKEPAYKTLLSERKKKLEEKNYNYPFDPSLGPACYYVFEWAKYDLADLENVLSENNLTPKYKTDLLNFLRELQKDKDFACIAQYPPAKNKDFSFSKLNSTDKANVQFILQKCCSEPKRADTFFSSLRHIYNQQTIRCQYKKVLKPLEKALNKNSKNSSKNFSSKERKIFREVLLLAQKDPEEIATRLKELNYDQKQQDELIKFFNKMKESKYNDCVIQTLKLAEKIEQQMLQ
ncbi:hypothetical protein [Holospora curviuscula]|uniref:hypothetical protein n=1 Tax=Holospora curviuscula TaxID=1082868 RepID=UPI001A9C6B43|nr:hypothetical protein [Holospora curviuscula]